MAQRLKDLDPAIIYGPIPMEQRERSIRRFERGKCKIIIASKVFTKGIDVPSCNTIVDGAHMASADNTQQKFGRGVRKLLGKRGLIYFDVGDVKVERKDNSMTRATKDRINAFRSLGVPVLDCGPEEAYRRAVLSLSRLRKGKPMC
jgi:superfamily II DNA or RNA helicase